jgi:hypothetical protein
MGWIMATNPDGYDGLMAHLATTSRLDAEAARVVEPPAIKLDLVPGEGPPQEQREASPELIRFYQLRAEHRPDTATEQPTEEVKAALPDWVVAALLAGCAEMGERRRREDQERRARERREREEEEG